MLKNLSKKKKKNFKNFSSVKKITLQVKKTFSVIATNQETLTPVKKVLLVLQQAKHPWSGNSTLKCLTSDFRTLHMPNR